MRIGIVVLLALLPALAQAHGGGLDANGGHYNRTTGEYHCHREPCFSNQKKQQEGAQEKAKPAKAKGRPSTAKPNGKQAL